jgi:hypothetical protein
MKLNIFLVALLLPLFYSCNRPVKGDNGVTYKSPVQYNDYIVSRQTKLMKNVLSFGETAQTDIDSAASMLGGFAKETQSMIQEIKGMPPYKGDSSLRDAAVRSFTFYKRVFEEDYVDLINIRKKEDITEDDMAEMNRIVDKISKEEEGFDKAFHSAQNDFAKKNNMKLRENEMQKKIDEFDQ